ncbi:MAG: methionine--tRNA ligase [Phycisphaerae bacterium]|nr:methionine--tRNA ligase [Phycisphaerae bacterium]
MAQRRLLVTAALPYSNGRLHVGHIAGAYLPADIYVRYLRQRGDDVRFICGSDDNGVAITITAAKEKTTPQDVCGRYRARQEADFDGLGIRFDIYGGTHSPECVELHNRISQGFFLETHKKGLFTKKTTKQLYDAQAGKFLPDRYVQGTCPFCKHGGAYGDQCEDCGRSMDPLALIEPRSTITGSTPEVRETTHWYLRLGEFEARLKVWLESKRESSGDEPAWREATLNFALGQIKASLPERAMTRDLEWGVPVPLPDDPDAAGKVLYVWFDAPIGYVSFTARYCERADGDWKAYERWWKDPACRIIHFIGEDNTVFHALTWPAMLMAEGSFQLPSAVVVNAFLNERGPDGAMLKLSKSRMGDDSALWIEQFLKGYDPDPLRYYLTSIAPENQRGAFEMREFLARNNDELVANLGNLFNRTLTFAKKYFDNKVPEAGTLADVDHELLAALPAAFERIGHQIEHFHFKAALADLMQVARSGNQYFDAKQPWAQRKTDLAGCGTTIHVCLQMIRALTTLMAPFLPFSATKALALLNVPADGALAWDPASARLTAGHPLGEPEVLVKKLDIPE